MKILPLMLTDMYKTDHRRQYPEGTEKVYSNLTARGSRIPEIDYTVVFGIQYFIREYLISRFSNEFFHKDKESVVKEYKRRLDNALGMDSVPMDHIEDLHDLGYLPIELKALPEGFKCPLRVPCVTITNTDKRFYWLTNFLETLLSTVLWGPMTSATMASRYRTILDSYAEKTSDIPEFVDFQGHDFSMRGLMGIEAGCVSGGAHLTSFKGTDTIPAIDFLERYYDADSDKELIGCSVPACYCDKTEILTENGFKLFEDLDQNEKVAQHNDDFSVNFVLPNDYIRDRYKGKMIDFSHKNHHTKFSACVTPNHKMVRTVQTDENMKFFESGDMSDVGYGRHYNYVVSGFKDGNTDLDDINKFLIAFQADGSLSSKCSEYTGERTGAIAARFSLKKDRKADRLRSILNNLEWEYTESKYKSGYYSFRIAVPLNVELLKDFSWVNLENKSSKWAYDFIQELSHWDGSKSREHSDNVNYSSCDPDNVIKIQAIASICGMRATFNEYIDKRGDRLPIYSTTVTKNHIRKAREYVQREEIDYDGFVYCVSVPSKRLIIRHKGNVMVCGNTEHSVMCLGGNTDEFETFKNLITKVYPKGIVSIVSDTWDYWQVLTDFLPRLKKEIIARDGKVTIRPDSGDPVDIVCGDIGSYVPHIAKGSIEVLWDIFGGKINSKGFKQLDSHIGLIYGDSITLDRCTRICKRLQDKGFASTNIVFGIGSYCVTPDTLILCDNFQWEPAGDLKQGQGIICFNENPVYGTGSSSSRKYTRGKIINNNLSSKKCVEIKCSKKTIKCSTDHPFLILGQMINRNDFYSNKPSKEEAKKLPRGKGLIWKKANEIKKGDQIAYFGDPWEYDESREAGWLAGIYDGEGTLYTGTSGRSFAAWKVSLSQNKGLVLNIIRKLLKKMKFSFYENPTPSGCVRNVLTGGFYEHARFLGKIAPKRLLKKGYPQIKDLPVFKNNYTYKFLKVTSVKEIGRRKVSSITTSEGTFITNGFLSHNTYQYTTRDTFGFAMKATYGEVNGEAKDIYKDPKTDDGLKKSAKGLLKVTDDLKLEECVSWEEEKTGALVTYFRDGEIIRKDTLEEIRQRLLKK